MGRRRLKAPKEAIYPAYFEYSAIKPHGLCQANGSQEHAVFARFYWVICKECKLEFNDSALQADHGGVSTIVGSQFGKDAFHSAFDGFF